MPAQHPKFYRLILNLLLNQALPAALSAAGTVAEDGAKTSLPADTNVIGRVVDVKQAGSKISARHVSVTLKNIREIARSK